MVLKFGSNVKVFGMDSSLLKVNPDQMKQLSIASEPTCPQCKSRIVYRTKRRGVLERIILYPLGFRAYRCKDCENRFCSNAKRSLASQEE
jgi:DNA-directed RNA polymerase subunit RPC12/RpoP